MDNPTQWTVLDPNNTANTIMIDITGLLMWASNTDGNGTFIFYQTIDTAADADFQRQPTPVLPGLWPNWPYPTPGWPAGFAGPSKDGPGPAWPTPAPPAVVPAAPIVGTVPPSPGEGAGLRL
jgi:hypothetical protein